MRRTRRRRWPSSRPAPVILAPLASLSVALPSALSPPPRSPPLLPHVQELEQSRPATTPELRRPPRFAAAGEVLHDSARAPPSPTLPSLGFAPNPATSPSLQSRRRAPRSAAAPARRAAPPPPLLARAAAGEPRRHLRITVRTPPFPLWPRPVAPLRAAAARRRRARACARRHGRAHAAVKAGLALTRLGGPLARGPRLSAPGLAGWGCT